MNERGKNSSLNLSPPLSTTSPFPGTCPLPTPSGGMAGPISYKRKINRANPFGWTRAALTRRRYDQTSARRFAFLTFDTQTRIVFLSGTQNHVGPSWNRTRNAVYEYISHHGIYSLYARCSAPLRLLKTASTPLSIHTTPFAPPFGHNSHSVIVEYGSVS